MLVRDGEFYEGAVTDGYRFERCEAVRREETITVAPDMGPQVDTLTTTTLLTMDRVGLQVPIALVRAPVTLWVYVVCAQGGTQVQGTPVNSDAVNAAYKVIGLHLTGTFQ